MKFIEKPSTAENGYANKQLLFLLRELKDMIPLLGMDWLKEFHMTIKIIITVTDQSEKKWIPSISKKFSSWIKRWNTSKIIFQMKPSNFQQNKKIWCLFHFVTSVLKTFAYAESYLIRFCNGGLERRKSLRLKTKFRRKTNKTAGYQWQISRLSFLWRTLLKRWKRFFFRKKTLHHIL